MLFHGDNLDILKKFPDESIDSVVTDPPYGLSREPDMREVLEHWIAGDDYTHRGRGFMGKAWDSFVPGPALWREVYRVLKPGAHVLSFFGTRTYDMGVLAMRIAGFEIRDQIDWIYGSGFPKSLDFAADTVETLKQGRRVIKAEFENHPQAEGYGTALKPAHEPIVLARKPLAGTVSANVLEHGTGGLAIDACRIGDKGGTRAVGPAPNNNNVFGQNMGGQAYEPAGGRWPANVLFNGEAAALLDVQSGNLKGGTAVRRNNTRGGVANIVKAHAPGTPDLGYGDSGGASRFFYVAKPSTREREAGCEHLRKASAGEMTGGREEGSAGLDNPRAGAGRKSEGRANVHPTVKPIELMRYLVRLVTPPGGLVLDPFAGSGTTLCAAALERRKFIGCEINSEYCEIAKARIAYWTPKG